MPLLLPGEDFSSLSASSLGLDAPTLTPIDSSALTIGNDPILSLPDVPSYSLASAPTFGSLNLNPSPSVPNQSGGFLSSIGNWFSSPSNANAGASILSLGGGLATSVASFFNSNKAPSKSNPQPGPSLMGSLFGGISRGWQSTTQGIGTGLGNITGGTTRPLIPMLALIVVGLLMIFLIMRRV